MAQNSSFEELQEIGVVALIGLTLVPGALWIVKAPTGVRMAARAALVAGILVGIIATEQQLDSAANGIANKL